MNADADAPPEFDLSCPAARTLLVGQLSRDEQAAVATMLPSSRLWRRAENLLQAQLMLSEFRIDRILLAQARPGQLPLDTPEQLHAWAPAAELLAVAGDWCEGELRTGQPWEGVPRLYWWQLAPAAVGSPPDGAAPLVLVNAASYDAGSMWTDTLRGLGYPSLWTRRGRREPLHFGERLAIWDGDQLDGQEADLLAAFCRRRRRAQAPVIAVFDYPRADVVATANRVGVTAVLGRPWSWEALELALTRAIQQESPASRPERVTPRLAA